MEPSINFKFIRKEDSLNNLGEYRRIESAKKAVFNTSNYPYFPFMRKSEMWPIHSFKDSAILLEFGKPKPTGRLILYKDGSIDITIDEISDYDIMMLEFLCYLTAYVLEYVNRYLLKLNPPKEYEFILSAEKYKDCKVDYSGLPENEQLPLLNTKFAPNIPNEEIPISTNILLPICKDKPPDTKKALNVVQYILKEMIFKVEGKRVNPLGKDMRSRLNISTGVIDNIIWNALYTIQDSTIIDTDKILGKKID